MYKLARLRFDSTISFLATLSALLLIGRNLDGGNYTEEYAVLFISIGIYVCVKILLDKDRLIWWRGVVNGIACGAVLLLRPNMAGAWVVLCVIIFFRYILQRQIKNSLLFALYFLLGISIACMPVLLYFHVNEGMQDFIFSYFIFNFGYSNIDNSFMNSLNGMFVQIRAMAIDGSLFTILIGCILCIYQGLKTKKERVFWWSIPFAFFVSFYFASMSGKGYAHYRMILAPLMIIPMALLFRYAYSFVKKHLCKGFIKKAHAIAIPLVLLMVLNIGLIAYNGGMFILRIPENRRRTVCLEDAASFLNTNMLESDQLLVFSPNETILYYDTGRRPPSKYLYIPPVNNDFIIDSLDEYVRHNTPRFIVANYIWNRNDDRLFLFVRENYTIASDYIFNDSEHGGFYIYEYNK